MAAAEEEGSAPIEPVIADELPPAEGEEEAGGTSGWFRVDTDALETQFWVGATHSLGSVDIASDIYVVGSFAEFDIGPSFSFGNLALTPMVGLGFDFSTTDVSSLIAPQLFTIYDAEKLYFESWIQVFVNSIFTEGAEDSFYTRNFLLYKLADEIAVGPQAELTYRINEEDMMFERATTSLPVGGRVNLGYGAKNTLGIFLGYETKATDGADGVAGRFTFVRSW